MFDYIKVIDLPQMVFEDNISQLSGYLKFQPTGKFRRISRVSGIFWGLDIWKFTPSNYGWMFKNSTDWKIK
jgi:hypothetical protein